MSIVTQQEVQHYADQAFENQGEKNFAFCKITHPTLPGSLDYARSVLCTVLSQVNKMASPEDPRIAKLQGFLDVTKGSVDIKHLAFTSAKCPSRLGYTARLYSVEEESQLRDIKEMYLKEDEVAVRTEIGKYDIVDAISAVDAVDEYKQVFHRLQNKDQAIITKQVKEGYFKELSCFLLPDLNNEISVKDFNKLMELKDPKTGHNVHNPESFAFFLKGVKKVPKNSYEGEYIVDTVYVDGNVEDVTYTFRTYDPKLEVIE